MSLFNSLKDLVTPELISTAAGFLGEDKSKVTSAVGSAIPSLLGSLLHTGDSPKLGSILEQAGNAGNIMSGIGNIFSGNADSSTGNIGSGFLSAILGDKLSPFISLISKVSGISSESSGKLISSIAPVVAGFLGGKMKTDGLNLGSLLKLVGAEKNSFMSLIPSGLTSVLGISSLGDIGSNLLGSVSGGVKQASKVVENGANKSSSLLKWLIPLLVIAAALFFFWRSCSKPIIETPVLQEQVDKVLGKVEETTEKVLAEVQLPNGVNLKGLKGGLEEKIVAFLNSDAYTKATEEDLKDKWFDFDNINFEVGTTNLTPESQPQIINLVAILKHYSDSKIKIGAYTDKTGDAAHNLTLSKNRADAIKSVLTTAGVGSQISAAEGYGASFAKIPADATDQERASDRKVSIRFVK